VQGKDINQNVQLRKTGWFNLHGVRTLRGRHTSFGEKHGSPFEAAQTRTPLERKMEAHGKNHMNLCQRNSAFVCLLSRGESRGRGTSGGSAEMSKK